MSPWVGKGTQGRLLCRPCLARNMSRLLWESPWGRKYFRPMWKTGFTPQNHAHCLRTPWTGPTPDNDLDRDTNP